MNPTTTLPIKGQDHSKSSDAARCAIEFDFLRATENAALNAIPWLGRGEKELADAAATYAIRAAFEQINIRGLVAIGEGSKDNAPGIFYGEQLGRWADGSPKFDIALDPIDGTGNVANGLPNAISAMAFSRRNGDKDDAMPNLPCFYAHKLAYGPAVVQAMRDGLEPVALGDPLEKTFFRVAEAVGKPMAKLAVAMLNRPRHAEFIATARRCGVTLRLISDGDIAAAIAPALPDSGVDIYYGIGGSPEGVLAAAALKTLGGDLQLQMWPRDEEERARAVQQAPPDELERVFTASDLVKGDHTLFCATGICDGSLLPGVKLSGARAITHSVLMCSRNRTVRYIQTVHDLKASNGG